MYDFRPGRQPGAAACVQCCTFYSMAQDHQYSRTFGDEDATVIRLGQHSLQHMHIILQSFDTCSCSLHAKLTVGPNGISRVEDAGDPTLWSHRFSEESEQAFVALLYRFPSQREKLRV